MIISLMTTVGSLLMIAAFILILVPQNLVSLAKHQEEYYLK